MTFAPIRYDGGGLLQDLYFSGDGYLYLGSDTQGTYRTQRDGTTNLYGQSAIIRNRGQGPQNAWHQVAAIFAPQFDPGGAGNTVLIAVGDNGTNGGIMRSTDRMDTWSMLSTVPQYSGGTFHVPGGVQQNWQRSGRRYFAEDSSFLFTATTKQGIMRSADHGNTWPVICNMSGVAPGSNYYARSLCQDPAVPTTLYAGFADRGGTTNFGGLWKCTTAHTTTGTPNFIQCSGLPAGSTVEDVLVIDGWVYAVLGTGGLWVASTANTNSWTQIGGTGALDPTSWWSSIDAINDGSGNHWIAIAGSRPVKLSGDNNYRCVVKFVRNKTSGAISSTLQMTNLTSQVNVNVVQIVGGTRTWWNSGTGLSLGKSGFVNPHIKWDPDPAHFGDIYMAASQGLYRWVSSLSQWQYCSNVMPQFLAHAITAASWGCLFTDSDFGTNIDLAVGGEDASTLNAMNPIGAAEAYAVAISEDETLIYTSSTATNQKYTTIAGDVFKATKALNPTWTAMNLASAVDPGTSTSEGSKTALGLCALNNSSGTKTLIAATPNTGIWYHNGTSWSIATQACCVGGSNNLVNFAHRPGSQYVYVFDQAAGIWRSNDYGQTWTKVYGVTSTDPLCGTIAAHPTRTGEIWFTTGAGLYKITGAHTGIVGSGATLTGPISVGVGSNAPGPCGISDTGYIYCCVKDNGSGSGLALSSDGVHWTNGDPTGSLAFINSRPENMAFIPHVGSTAPVCLISGSNVVDYGSPETAAALPTSGSFSERQASLNASGAAGTITLWNSQAVPPSGGAGTLANSSLFAEFEISDSSSGGALSNSDTNWKLLADGPSGSANSQVRTQIWGYLNCPAGLYADSSHLATWTYSNTAATVKGRLFEETIPAGYTTVVDVTATNGATTAVASPAALNTGSATSTYQGGLMRGIIGALGTAAFSSQTWSPTSPAVGDGNANNLTNVFNALRGTVPSTGASSMATTMTYSGGPMTSWAGSIVTLYAIPTSSVSITTTSFPHGSVGSAFSQTVATTGGVLPVTISLNTGSDPLPTGLTLTGSTGVVAGTPATGTQGTYNLVFKATDSASNTDIQAITLVIGLPLSYGGSVLANGTELLPYSASVAGGAAGGTPPYTYGTTATLPTGLALSSAGLLSGTPALGTSASYSVPVTVTDSLGHTATATFTLTIQPAVPISFPPPGGSENPITATLLDENLNVLGPINFSTLTAQLFYNAVGTWSMDIPFDDNLWQTVKKFVSIDPDTGVITVNGTCVVEIDWQGLFTFGGKVEVVGYSFAAAQQAGTGTQSGPITSPGPLITLSGGDYLALIANRIAFPDPTHSWPLQTAASSKMYTGALETVIKNLVLDNVGANATPARTVTLLDTTTSSGLGGTVSYNVRFSQGVDLNLMDIIRTLIGTGGPMGVKITRNGSRLKFDTYVPVDRTATAYFSPEIGNLTAVSFSLSDPTVTIALVQSGVAPLFSFVSENPDPTTMWGRVEQYVDQTSQTTAAQATQAGQDVLNQGAASPALSMNATDIPLLTFGRDYFLGDIVSVEPRFNDIYTDIVSGVTLNVDGSQTPTFTVVPTVGYPSDPGSIDPSFAAQLLKRVRRLERRLNAQIG